MNLSKMNKFVNYVPVFEENPTFILDEIINKAEKYLSSDAIDGIKKAYMYAYNAHKWVKRLSWEYYIVHPLRVTEFLMEIKPDLQSIQASLLHDVIEDTEITAEEIEENFGNEVRFLCEWLEKVSKVRYRWEDLQVETIKKTFLAMAKDLRVIFIKIADRIHNIQTLHYHPKPEKRKRIAEETMKIYVSLAKKLWLYDYQILLENWAFKALKPDDFEYIFSYLIKKFWFWTKYKQKWKNKLESILKKEWIVDFKVEWRIKSPWRIYQKMENKYKTKDISKVLDLLAYRIISKTIADCYIILWIIHKYYTPLIKKIKDYIAVPKFNWYKSIHTTILWVFSFPTEIQIRTEEMDEVAKYWVAAHFAYSEAWWSKKVNINQWLWIKKIQEIVERYQTDTNKEWFKDEMNMEILEKSIFIYTPKWDIIEMPKGSTVLDFAFHIHTDIWLRFKLSIVNWTIKQITYKPENWDIVEIKTYKNKIMANKHWLEFLTTPSAKYHLNKYLKKEKRDEIIKNSIILLDKKLVENNLPKYNSKDCKIKLKYSQKEIDSKMLELFDKKTTYTSFLKTVYKDSFKSKKIVKKTLVKKQKLNDNEKNKVVIDFNNSDLLYSFCWECNPVIWDKIIARSDVDGIKIHKTSCKWIKTVSLSKLLEAHWYWNEPSWYDILFQIELLNYNDVYSIISMCEELFIKIKQISVENSDDSKKIIFFLTISILNPWKILFLINNLKKYKWIKILKKKFI